MPVSPPSLPRSKRAVHAGAPDAAPGVMEPIVASSTFAQPETAAEAVRLLGSGIRPARARGLLAEMEGAAGLCVASGWPRRPCCTRCDRGIPGVGDDVYGGTYAFRQGDASGGDHCQVVDLRIRGADGRDRPRQDGVDRAPTRVGGAGRGHRPTARPGSKWSWKTPSPRRAPAAAGARRPLVLHSTTKLHHGHSDAWVAPW